jgi:8-oxo-dGTP pyrophosphatase MutT (NUDIX family)
MKMESEHRFAPRVTVATIVPGTGENLGRFLFVEESAGETLVINQPAGHLDAGESLLQAAVRETLEETGWHVRLTHLVGVYQYQSLERAYLRFCFAADAVQFDALRTLDHGIVRTLWLSREALIARQSQHRSVMVLKSLDDFLAGARHELGLLHAALL